MEIGSQGAKNLEILKQNRADRGMSDPFSKAGGSSGSTSSTGSTGSTGSKCSFSGSNPYKQGDMASATFEAQAEAKNNTGKPDNENINTDAMAKNFGTDKTEGEKGGGGTKESILGSYDLKSTEGVTQAKTNLDNDIRDLNKQIEQGKTNGEDVSQLEARRDASKEAFKEVYSMYQDNALKHPEMQAAYQDVLAFYKAQSAAIAANAADPRCDLAKNGSMFGGGGGAPSGSNSIPFGGGGIPSGGGGIPLHPEMQAAYQDVLAFYKAQSAAIDANAADPRCDLAKNGN